VAAEFVMHIFLMGNDDYAPILKDLIAQAFKFFYQAIAMLIVQLTETLINDESVNSTPFLQSLSDGYRNANGDAKSFASAYELERATKPLDEI
jgi:hypothetical protein